jgi:hypothetical protein
VHVDQDGNMVVRSPCCDQPARIPDWALAYARHNTGGVVRVQCGRDTTDPLLAVDPTRGRGCGGWYEVDVTGPASPGDREHRADRPALVGLRAVQADTLATIDPGHLSM